MERSTTPFALVVDDDAFIRMDASDILEAAGFQCYEAGSGDKAIHLLDEHSATVVLLFSDVEMPGATNGFALARHVDRHWPHIKIVISSGRLAPKPGEMPENATFIGKPFGKDVIHAHLREVLPDGVQPEALRQEG